MKSNKNELVAARKIKTKQKHNEKKEKRTKNESDCNE